MTKQQEYQNKRREYRAYLKSERWQSIRLRFRKYNEYRCFVCSRSKSLHLHHRTYERLGAELDDDLVYLCKKCHKRVHALANSFYKADRDVNIYNAPEELLARMAKKVDWKKKKRARKRARRLKNLRKLK